jgi:hypothetical protein
MGPEVELRAKLAAIGRRLKWLAVERRASWCVLPGLVAALALLAAHKLDRLDDPYPLMGLAVGVPLALGLFWGALRRVSLLDAACLADRTLGLKERMSNAVVFAERPEASPLVPALLNDAARHAEGLAPAAVVPYRASRPTRWSLFAAVLIAAAWFAPTYPLGRTPGQIAVRQQMREQGQRLGQIADKAKERAETRQLKKPAELAAKLQKLAKDLEKAKLSKKQALLKSGKLAAELREAQKLAALQAGAEGLSRTAAALRDVRFDTPDMQEIARAAREQRADEMAAKLAKLAQDLRAGNVKSPAERRKLAEDLRQMADGLEAGGMGDMAQALREAASAAEQGKDQAAADALDKAAQAANDAGQAAAENQTLDQMAQELEQSQQQVAQADEPQCEVHGSACPNPGGG